MFFFFNDTATTEIYTLSLHDALPISEPMPPPAVGWEYGQGSIANEKFSPAGNAGNCLRSEEHTSELQSQSNLVCRLLLEKKNIVNIPRYRNFLPLCHKV